MAKLIFTLSEIVDIASENISFPDKIESISAKDDKIYLIINPGRYIPNISITLTFNKFNDGKIFLLINTNKSLDIIARVIKGYKYNWLILDFPDIIIEINKFIAEKVTGVRIEQMLYDGKNMIIHTSRLSQ